MDSDENTCLCQINPKVKSAFDYCEEKLGTIVKDMIFKIIVWERYLSMIHHILINTILIWCLDIDIRFNKKKLLNTLEFLIIAMR